MTGRLLTSALFWIFAAAAAAGDLALFDAHIHYSSDAWAQYSPQDVLKILDSAGIRRALVSSTPDDGTVKLYDAAPARIVAELRPYRNRGDMGAWFNDASIVPYLEERLKRGIYRGIGEFHLHGDEAKSPVVKRLVELAAAKNLVLHAHSDARAVEGLFAINPRARVLWAHAGMSESVDTVGRMLARYPNLWVELSYRYDVAPGGQLDEGWRALFMRYPDKFLHGTDTWTPSRFAEVAAHAKSVRQWLAQLPNEVAENIAYKNAIVLYGQ